VLTKGNRKDAPSDRDPVSKAESKTGRAKKQMSTNLSEDELFKLKQRHLKQSQRALIAAELVTAKSGGHHSLGITMDVAAK
jgi:hypothetical protein